jgi:hypothetical protein
MRYLKYPLILGHEQMGCACKVPVENYPENAEWGPLFWKILHGLAELAGKQTNFILRQDELRFLENFLTSVQPVLPCDICRNHYKSYLEENPLQLATLPYEQVGLWVREWLWKLHNRINEGNDRPILPFEDLSTLYKGIDITLAWKMLDPVIKKAVSLQGISHVKWIVWLGHTRRLQGMYQ